MDISFGKIHDWYLQLNLTLHVDKVNNKSNVCFYKKGEEVKLSPEQIYFVDKGALSFGFKGDERVIGNIVEHMPLGLIERFCPLVELHYHCASDVTISSISHQDFDEIFFETSKEQMKELTTILIYMLVFMFDIHVERRSESGYHIIKSMLTRYLYRRLINADEKEGVASFIIKRTSLSRSYVFRVLAELKKGGYITIKKGKLISIDKTLPGDY
ncbi:Crp/Fnr family transcriptional regulator [Enterobacteriaceae bacterium RIT691]|uniref:Helix-turn-helix domain-containing protein n=1 Tax=Scandinavium hiltneri TaxID=2926519 RepID=A0ABT2DWZ8_9ENTR|nr:helix-turn-helix domain-containing protein [Scandinavium hiltneri]MCS2160052.1 helix-turn-helix domain-containing protein [Scandinavium hiltneri]MRS14088.1 Crp/Fnr family transcriptional regulator [Enterobacteriaceae bacterium RIT691]